MIQSTQSENDEKNSLKMNNNPNTIYLKKTKISKKIKMMKKLKKYELEIKKNDNNHAEQALKKTIYAERFEITASRLLGKGSFGEIYLAYDIVENGFCALKIESRAKNSQLKIEKSVLELTKDLEGFPKLIMFSSQSENNFMAMELLGPNLSDLFEFCKQKFTLQTTLLLGIQMLARIQDLHSKNYVHRDIKPENFLIGTKEKSNIVYVIDFGLSKKYKDSKMDHIPYREHRPLTGTTRYASINNHLGIEQSRRDDLEAIGYVLLYFIKKKLPWQGCQASTKQEKYNKILEKKLSVSIEALCKDLPFEFTVYMNYVRSLRYDERPDYNFLKGMFVDLLCSLYSEKFYFDWTLRYPDDAPNIKSDGLKIIPDPKTKTTDSLNKYFEQDKDKDLIRENSRATNNDEKEKEKVSPENSYALDRTDDNIMANFDGDEFIQIIKQFDDNKKKGEEVALPVCRSPLLKRRNLTGME